MAIDLLSILSPFTLGIPLVVAIVLWRRINSISKTIDVEEEKKNNRF